jgi:hypothetical protein
VYVSAVIESFRCPTKRATSATSAEHRQLVVNVELGPPLVVGVLVVARLPAALGADKSTVVCVRHAPRLPP